MAGLTPDRPIRLAIVDDDPLVRAGLRILLGGSPDIEIVAEATDGAEAMSLADAHRPDVILMDIRMPKVDGLIATQRIRRRHSPPQVIVLTTFNADEYVLEALRCGASGFLLKDTAPRDIIEAVRTVAAGAAILSPAVIRQLIDHVADPASSSRRAHARTRLSTLTERETRRCPRARAWPGKRGDRRSARHERADCQGPCLTAARQARAQQPGAGGPPHPRRPAAGAVPVNRHGASRLRPQWTPFIGLGPAAAAGAG